MNTHVQKNEECPLNKAARTKTAIYRAALQLFADTGAEQLGVSELAEAAGFSRGTIYNNLDTPVIHFADLSPIMAQELQDMVEESFQTTDDPAERIVIAIKTVIRRAHHEPVWADFVLRHVLVDAELQRFWSTLPAHELRRGLETGLFDFEPNEISSAISVMGGSTLIGVLYVRQGVKGWRDSGFEIAELVLRSVGVSKADARRYAALPLPDAAGKDFVLTA